MEYYEVQKIAKETIEYAKKIICPQMNLRDVRKLCEERMMLLGADSFWYWDIGAFVFSGEETTLSVSGRDYVTSNRVIGENDILTIDLSPQNNNIWGDYARTLIIENGEIVDKIDDINNLQWKDGLLMENKLHDELRKFANPNTTFEELYFHMNQYIADRGYINLDFLGNLGHSIVKDKDDRIYIEKGNQMRLGEVDFFTFEPHISTRDSVYGYKKENIYFFKGDKIIEL